MKTYKLLFFLFITIFAIHPNIFSQQITKKWVMIQNMQDRVIYIDTTSIKQTENHLIVWSLILYRTPIDVSVLQQKVMKVKSQYIFNMATQRYSNIGTLYYGPKGHLIGELSNPRLVGGGNAFSLPISSNHNVLKIFESAKKYLKKPNIKNNEIKFLKNFTDSLTEKKNSNVDSLKFANTVKTRELQKDTTSLKSNPNTQARLTNQNKKTSQKKDNNFFWNDSLVLINKAGQKHRNTIRIKNKVIYNFKNEKNVTNRIFTDGKLFVIQVSSWKHKKIAERIARKLKNKGYNAFVMEVYLPKMKSKWNRVRIGYFKSLKEAKKVQRKLR